MSIFDYFKKKNEIDPYVDRFADEMEAFGLPVKIAEIRRTQARQLDLYAQGRTRHGPVVTWTTKSKHVAGRAFDFDFVNGEDNSDPDAWEVAGEVATGLGLIWGGDWDVQDLRHAELPSEKT